MDAVSVPLFSLNISANRKDNSSTAPFTIIIMTGTTTSANTLKSTNVTRWPKRFLEKCQTLCKYREVVSAYFSSRGHGTATSHWTCRKCHVQVELLHCTSIYKSASNLTDATGSQVFTDTFRSSLNSYCCGTILDRWKLL